MPRYWPRSALDRTARIGKPAPMFPIRDHNPSQKVPYVTWLLIALNVVVFLSYLPLFQDSRQLFVFFAEWGMVPARIAAGEGWHTLFTSQFLHGDWLHLGFNLLFLWIFGDNMEEEWGHAPFLGFYLVCGAGAALMQMAAEPGSFVPMVGASGAIAGVLGGYLLMFPRARVDVFLFFVIFFRIIPVPAWIMLGLWFAIQVLGGLASPADEGGVAYWAHAGGFVIGMVLTVPLWLRRGGVGYWSRTEGHPPHPEARYRHVRTSVPRVNRGRIDDRPRKAGSGPWGRAGNLSDIPRVPRRPK